MIKKICFYCPEDIFQNGGGATVASNILKNMPLEKDVEILFSTNTEVPVGIIDKHKIRYINFPKNNILRILFDLFIAPFILHKYRFHRIICLNSLVPLIYPFDIEVFFQMRMFHFEEFDTLQKKIKNLLGVLSIKKSKYVYVASKDHKNDIVNHLQINPEKVKVAYLGFDFDYRKEDLLDDKLAKTKYWLFISIFRPYKNIDGLIEAYGQLRKKYSHDVPKLYLLGDYPNNYKDIDAYKKEIHIKICNYGMEEYVIFLGIKEHNEAMRYLANSDLFIFPSRFEGFGLPILEAMALNIPVLSSKVHSLPEIGADTIKYFSPEVENDLFEKLEEILLKGYDLDTSIAKNRSKVFKWEKTVNVILQN